MGSLVLINIVDEKFNSISERTADFKYSLEFLGALKLALETRKSARRRSWKLSAKQTMNWSSVVSQYGMMDIFHLRKILPVLCVTGV